MKAYFEDLAAYNYWADQKMISWLGKLSEEQWQQTITSSFSSIRQTAVHIASAENIWMDFWHKAPDPVYLSSGYSGGKDELLAIWQVASRGIVDFINKHAGSELEDLATFIYPDGRVGRLPYFQTFAHCINHATYHRGQLVTLLRQVGYGDFSSLDLATFYLQQKS